jgi:hypothetical protein
MLDILNGGRWKMLRIALICTAVLFTVAGRSQAEVPERMSAERNNRFDHGGYSGLLEKYVDDGKVDYVSLKRDRDRLDSYLEGLARLSPEALGRMPRDEQLTFYINAYNALTLKVIIDNYPVKSIKDIPGVWKELKFPVAGKELTLDEIEHGIVRKKFKEPRIHFALVCASKSCPKLRPEAYTGASLNRMLNEEARRFISDPSKVKLDKDRNTLYLSPIFKWFRGDFGDVREFVSRYLSEDAAGHVREKRPWVRYLGYDWTLNGKDEELTAKDVKSAEKEVD